MCAGTSIPFCYVSSRFLLPMVSERHQYVHWSRWLHQRFLAPERSVPAKRQLLGRLRPVAQSGGYASVAFRATMDCRTDLSGLERLLDGPIPPTHGRRNPPGVSPPMFSGRQTVLMGWQASTDSDRLGEGLRTTAGCSTVEGSPIRLQPSPQQVTGNRPPHGLEPLETALASSGGGKRSPKQVQEAGAVAGTPRVLSLWRKHFTPATHTGHAKLAPPVERKVGPRRFTWRQAVSHRNAGSIDQRRGAWDGLAVAVKA